MEARRGKALSAGLKAQAVSVPQPSLALMLRYSWKKLISSTFFLLLRGRRGHFRPVPHTKPPSMEARRREAHGSGASGEGRFRAAPPGFYAPSAHGRMAAVSHAHFCAAQVKASGCYAQRKRQIEKKIKKNIASLRRDVGWKIYTIMHTPPGERRAGMNLWRDRGKSKYAILKFFAKFHIFRASEHE